MGNSNLITHRAANEPAAHYLNICHSNAQSLSLHMSEIRKVAQDNNVQIFGITETHVTPSVPSITVEIPHFKIFRVDRIGKASSGVSIYVHESISAKEVCRSAQPAIYQKRQKFLFLEEALFDNSACDFTVIMEDFTINWLSSSSPRNTLSDILTCYNSARLLFTPTSHERKINGHESHTAID